MKRLVALFSLAVSVFAFTGCTPTQELRQGASFEGLTAYYIMPVTGGDNFFKQLGARNEYDEALYNAIKEFMAERGFKNVETAEEAQFALRPIYSEWNYRDATQHDLDLAIPEVLPPGMSLNQLYLNLEMEAYLPSIEKWAWRGFSYTKLSRENMTVAVIKEQVQWCLQHFPPEQHPSQTQIDANAEKPEAAKAEAPASAAPAPVAAE